MKLLNYIILALFFTGCGTVVKNPDIALKSNVNYELNKEQAVTVGSQIISIRRIKEYPGMTLQKSFQAPEIGISGRGKYNFTKGQKFWVHKVTNTGRLLLRTEDLPVDLAIQSDKEGTIDSSKNDGWMVGVGSHSPYLLNQKIDYEQYVKVVGSEGWPKEKLFEKSENGYPLKGSFTAEIKYSGKNGDNIRATYREFGDDLIRAAFSQDLTYNLKENDIIAYKTIKIKVIKATNSELKYKVIEDGGLPWVPKN